MTAKRVGLFGNFGSGNFGNDGSLEAMLAFLRSRRPDATLTCICSRPERVQDVFKIDALPLRWPRPEGAIFRMFDRALLKVPGKLGDFVQTFRQVRHFDVVFVPGTGILDDFGESPFGMPLTLFRLGLALRVYRKRFAFICIGAGPIHHPLSRRLMKMAAAMADYRSYRDQVSKSFMQSLDFDTSNDAVYPDIVFRLPWRRPHEISDGQVGKGGISLSPHAAEQPVTIGVGVMDYFGWRNDRKAGTVIYEGYLAKLATFVLWLLDQGYDVRTLMGENSDRQAVDDLSAALSRQRPDWPRERVKTSEATSLHDLMDQMSETQLVVGTRFHNVVCAAMLGKPIVCLSYADKHDVLMADMGLGAFCQHVEHFEVDKLIEQFSTLMAARQGYETSIRNSAAAYAKSLAQQEELLVAKFL